jgi:predicted nucleic acid-binding protein
MRFRIFLDTNILISGIFFEGNEAKIFDMIELDLITSEDVVDELRRIAKKKLKYLGERTLEIALLEIDRALCDMEILPRERYREKLSKAKELIPESCIKAHLSDMSNLSFSYSDQKFLFI